MKKVLVNCPNCDSEIEVNDNYNKTICNKCGSSFDVKKAIEIKKDNELYEKHIIKNKTEKELLNDLDELIKENKYDDALKMINRINSKDKFILEKLLKVKLCLFKDKDIDKLLITDDNDNYELWDEVREIVKLYNSLEGDTLDEEDILLANRLNKLYKDMLIDKELCEKINNLLNKYYIIVKSSKHKNAYKKCSLFFKDLLNVRMVESYGIKRDKTINYLHYGDNKKYKSKINNYNSLKDIYDVLNDSYDDFNNYINKNTNYLLFIIGIIMLVIIFISVYK